MLTQEIKDGPDRSGRIRNKYSTGLCALLCSVAAGAWTVPSGPAEASLLRKFPVKRNEEVKKEQPAPRGPLMIDVSIANQRLTVFDDGVPVAHAPVSTGMTGHPTPMGVFSVIQKQKWHQSNIYSGAPMPFMQRITWSGVALHAGVLPGYPASHGCIRMPHEFAVRLYGMTRVGVRVFVTHNEITPVAISDPHLFTPKPLDPPSALPPVIDGATTDVNPRVASTQAVPPLDTLSVSRATTDRTVPNATDSNSGQVVTTQAITSPALSGQAVEDPPKTVEGVPPDTDKSNPAQSAGEGTDNSLSQPTEVGHNDGGSTVNARDAAPRSDVTASTADHISSGASAVAELNSRTSISQTDAATMDGSSPDVPVPPARPQVQLKPGPVSIFISRKLGRLFVRKGFEPVFDTAVTITDPTRPFGTHVFTAAGYSDDNHSAMRWLLVSLPFEAVRKEERRAPGKASHRFQEEEKSAETQGSATETASAALARINVPDDARERIAELLSPGASLIVSDKDLGPETGTESDTDFIVLTR